MSEPLDERNPSSKSDDKYILGCIRAEPGSKPMVPAYQEECTLCGHQVWRAYSSPIGMDAVCLECLTKIDPKDMRFAGFTDKQIAELRAYMGFKHN
jgi:hypothetical protein